MERDDFMREMKARIAALKAGVLPPPKRQERMPAPKPPEMPSAESVKARKNRAYGRMNRLHATLRHIGDDEGRRLAAIEILRLEREVQACWKAIDHFDATGELIEVGRDTTPEEPPFDPAEHSAAELARMLASAKAYISKARKKGYAEEKVRERTELIRTIEEYMKAR